MPGPRSNHSKTNHYEPREPNQRAAARLARCQADWSPTNSQNGQQMHMPGSQNRKK